MYYLIYKTTNLINNKIYIGKHKTENLNDDYLGSGIYFNNAVRKYGRENFKREILFECSSEEEMNLKESEIVNEEFLNRDDVYNLKLGGDGGFDFIHKHNLSGKGPKKLWRKIKSDPKRYSDYIEYLKEVNRKYQDSLTEEDKKEIGSKISKSLKDHYQSHKSAWIGLHHTAQSKEIISQKMKSNPKIMGSNNGMYGKRFIHNIETKKTSIINKSDPLPDGFAEGRYIRYNTQRAKRQSEKDQILLKHISKLLAIMFSEWRKYCNEKFSEDKKSKHIRYTPPSKISDEQVKEWYEEYIKNGYWGVVEKFHYDKSCPNLVGIFKSRIPNFIPQQGKRRKPCGQKQDKF